MENQEHPAARVREAVKGYLATTVPVRVELSASQTVVSLSEAESILRRARALALGPCVCRTDAGVCDHPIDVCLALDEAVDEAPEGFRPTTPEEALAVLRMSHEAGLVHLAYRRSPGGAVTELCSCCSCACWFLRALAVYDYHEAIIESHFIAVQDEDACVGCGTCAARCPFGAYDRRDGAPRLRSERCFGCGVCVTTCPAGALSLARRDG